MRSLTGPFYPPLCTSGTAPPPQTATASPLRAQTAQHHAGGMCCLNMYCCTPCILGKMMELAGLGSCFLWCCCGGGGPESAPPRSDQMTPRPALARPAPADSRPLGAAIPMPASADHMFQRTTVAAKYGIQEDCCTTCCCACCCTYCSMCQVRTVAASVVAAAAPRPPVCERRSHAHVPSSPQVANEVMVNENLHFECMSLARAHGGPEEEQELEKA